MLPADRESAIAEVGALAALLDKNGWKAAAFIAVSVKPGEGHGGRTATSGRLSSTAFAKALNAKGWSKTIIQRHYDAWEAAANKGLVLHAADLSYGEKIDVPTEGWSNWYPPMLDNQHEDAEAIQTQARLEGTGASKAVDIAKNTKAMAAAIKASPKVAEAATQALIEKGDVAALSQATAAASRNRQVERNRARREEGLSKGRTVQDKPKAFTPDVMAFLQVQGLSTALRALVTTFPQEWDDLSDDAKSADFIAVCEDSFDKIEIALANCRNIVNGGVSDKAILRLLEGGVV